METSAKHLEAAILIAELRIGSMRFDKDIQADENRNRRLVPITQHIGRAGLLG